MATALGYIDELIRHLDARKPVFRMLGRTQSEKLGMVRPSREVASFLACNPKFTLPPLGQFYRPISDLEVMDNDKFNFYVEGFELDMLQFPPFENFILEFEGYSDAVRIKSSVIDVEYVKFVVLCRKMPDGIMIDPYYFNDTPIENIPSGWITNGIPFTLRYEPKEARKKGKYGNGFAIPFKPAINTDWPYNMLYSFVSTMWPEIRAVYQFLVAINVKSGVVRSTARTPKRPAGIGGRQTGFEYHILEIDPAYVTAEREGASGTHASPRFHLRRAHLREYAEDKFTFVKQAKVGNPMHGIVEKDYTLKKD